MLETLGEKLGKTCFYRFFQTFLGDYTSFPRVLLLDGLVVFLVVLSSLPVVFLMMFRSSTLAQRFS